MVVVVMVIMVVIVVVTTVAAVLVVVAVVVEVVVVAVVEVSDNIERSHRWDDERSTHALTRRQVVAIVNEKFHWFAMEPQIKLRSTCRKRFV